MTRITGRRGHTFIINNAKLLQTNKIVLQ